MSNNNRMKIGAFWTLTVFEAPEEKFDRMMGWARSKHKNSCEYSKEGPVLIQILDEDGNDGGKSEAVPDGMSPVSPEAIRLAKEMIAEMFGEEIPTVPQ